MPFNPSLSQLQAILSPYIWILLLAVAFLGAIAVILVIVAAVLRILQRLLLGVRDQIRNSKPVVMSTSVSGTVQPTETEAPQQPEQPEALQEDDEPVSPSRRRFLSALIIALGGIGTVIIGVPAISVLVSPIIRRDPEVWSPVGGVDDFQVGDTVQVTFRDPIPEPWAGFSARTAAWLRRESEQEFRVFSAYCTHVGCPLRWESGANLFMCPCHGGVFNRDGVVLAGPPPRPLPLYPVRIRNGQVEILTRPDPLVELTEWVRDSRCADEAEETESGGKDCPERLTRID